MIRPWGKTELRKANDKRSELGCYDGNEKKWREFLKKESKHRRMKSRQKKGY